uniref:Nicastrin n=1 Tax=Cyprinus carpio TaxID=7962 RepID=A0A8C2IX77_CYPCA
MCVSSAAGVCSSSVEQKIYVELNETVPCVRLLNATHQIGCQSSMSGDTGVLHVLETQSDLDWILSSGPHPPYMVIMETAFFNRSVMMKMKNSSRVSGVAVIVSKTGLAQNFSPHTTCPNQNTGVYSESYGSELANCNVTVWNPLGNGLSYEDFSFPVFALKDENQTQVIRKCYEDHNQRVNGSAPQYPLCAMQLFSHMHAVTDTVTCMRLTFVSLPPSEVLCDPLSDFNVWTSTRPLNSSAKGHAANESVVIAAARLDGRSFFWEQAPAAEGTVSGIITLLAAIQALYPVTQEAPPPRNIFFTFFQGEAFDYIGSSKMVYDMEKNDFVIDLKNVHSILEIGQVCLFISFYCDIYFYCYYVQKNNSWFRSLLPPEVSKKGVNSPGPPQFYIGLGPRIHGPVHSVTRFVQYILANLTGTVTNLTESQCQNPSELSTENKDLFSYFWVSGPASVNSTGEPFCVRASVRLSEAVSPAFELLEYGSRNYSTWTESRWKSIRARIFLVASRELEVMQHRWS